MKKINFFLGFIIGIFSHIALAVPDLGVARLSYIKGEVSFLPSGETNWVTATRNRPLTQGDRLWTGTDAQATLQLDNGALCLSQLTALSISKLEESKRQFEQQSGSVSLKVRELKKDQTYEIDTPNLAFSASQPGDYRIDVDADKNTTIVSVLSGQAEVYGENGNNQLIEIGKSYRFTGTTLEGYESVEINANDFQWCLSQKTPQTGEKRYVSPHVIGYQDLETHGKWSHKKDYGNVWQPTQVTQDWAPYRDGHWAWVQPWGWSWVADEEWGFAPFHYGRWVFDEGWYWVPGNINVYPVYAPALVVFMGDVVLGGNLGPGIGWFPLGFNEIYWPPYVVGLNDFININRANTFINVVDITNMFNQGFQNLRINYVNRRLQGITAIPASAFAQGRSVRQARVGINKAALEHARTVNNPTIQPSKGSMMGGAHKAKTVPSAKIQSRATVKKSSETPQAPSALSPVKKPVDRPVIKVPDKKIPKYHEKPKEGRSTKAVHMPVSKSVSAPHRKPSREQVKPQRKHPIPTKARHPQDRPKMMPNHRIRERGQIRPQRPSSETHYPRKPNRRVPQQGHMKSQGRPPVAVHPSQGAHRVPPGYHRVPRQEQFKARRGQWERHHPNPGQGGRREHLRQQRGHW